MDVKSLLPLCFLMFITSITSSRRLRNRKGLREKFTDQGTCELEISCKGNIKTPVRLPIKGPRGPPGIPGEKGATGLPGVPGIPGKPGKSPPSIPTQLSQRTAFFVGLDKNYIPNNSTNVLAYTKVITNEGEAYDSSTGRFTAPVNGTYHFTVVVAAKIRQKPSVLELLRALDCLLGTKISFHTNGTEFSVGFDHLKQQLKCCCDADGRTEDDIYGVGGKHTDVVNSIKFSHTSTIPRRASVAGGSSTLYCTLWIYVFQFLWFYFISKQ